MEERVKQMVEMGGRRPPTKKKRKLTLNEIGRCHPSHPLKGKGCLPAKAYSSLSRKMNLGQNPKWGAQVGRKTKRTRRAGNRLSLYHQVGCVEGANHCLLDKSSLPEVEKEELRKRYLRPRKPKEWRKKPNMWLDNFNIQHVMEQYQTAYKWFHFLGVFPIDFSAPDPYRKNGKVQCLNQELCTLNLKEEFERDIRGIGMVFNLDPHDKGGSHWVALWIDIKDFERGKVMAGFFDSYGYKVPDMIARFMRSLQLQVKTCTLGYNARRFQYGHSECGMFSIYFLICMIHGIPFEEFCKDALHDRSMLELRNVLFGE